MRVRTDPIQEAIAKKLSGFESVSKSEQAKMIKRAAVAGAKAAKLQAEAPREPQTYLTMPRRVGLLTAKFPGVLAYHAKILTQLDVMQCIMDWNKTFEEELISGFAGEISKRFSGPDRYRYLDLNTVREGNGYLGKELGVVIMSVSTAERLLKENFK